MAGARLIKRCLGIDHQISESVIFIRISVYVLTYRTLMIMLRIVKFCFIRMSGFVDCFRFGCTARFASIIYMTFRQAGCLFPRCFRPNVRFLVGRIIAVRAFLPMLLPFMFPRKRMNARRLYFFRRRCLAGHTFVGRASRRDAGRFRLVPHERIVMMFARRGDILRLSRMANFTLVLHAARSRASGCF